VPLLIMAALLAGPVPAYPSSSTVVVNSTTDVSDGDISSVSALVSDPGPDGVISLREAILATNNTPEADTIEFSIPPSDPGYDAGTGVWTIRPDSALPALNGGGTAIDGSTQTTNQGDSNPDGPEIQLDGSGISTASLANALLPPSELEALIADLTAVDRLAELEPRLAGLQAEIEQAKPALYGDHGLEIRSANNTIRALVINRFGSYGVYIYGSGATGNRIVGCYIGTDASGAMATPNWGGIIVSGAASGNFIGGTTAADRNVISGNSYNGVYLYGNGTRENTIQGNYIGLDATGSYAIPNAWGVTVWSGAAANRVGGTAAGAGNVISGNQFEGIDIQGTGSNLNVVQGNLVGLDATGTIPVPNGLEGIEVSSNAAYNTIGGTEAGAANIIAYNSRGVHVSGVGSLRNTIRGNSIFSNDYEGIRLYDDANQNIEPPTITGAGSVQGTACFNCAVDIYSDDDDQGRIFEGSTTAGGNGDFSWPGTPQGPYVTATNTDANGNTSEFSVPVSPPVPPPPEYSRYDLDRDCDIDIVDIMEVASRWGCRCGDECYGTAVSAISQVEPRPLMRPASVRVEPDNSMVASGETFTVTVEIERAVDLGAFQLALNFGPTVVHVEDMALGNFLGSTGRNTAPLGPEVDNAAGTVTFGAFSFGDQPAASGDGVLATIILMAQGTGSSPLALESVQVADIGAQSQTVMVEGGRVMVAGPLRIHLPLIVGQ